MQITPYSRILLRESNFAVLFYDSFRKANIVIFVVTVTIEGRSGHVPGQCLSVRYCHGLNFYSTTVIQIRDFDHVLRTRINHRILFHLCRSSSGILKANSRTNANNTAMNPAAKVLARTIMPLFGFAFLSGTSAL